MGIFAKQQWHYRAQPLHTMCLFACQFAPVPGWLLLLLHRFLKLDDMEAFLQQAERQAAASDDDEQVR